MQGERTVWGGRRSHERDYGCIGRLAGLSDLVTARGSARAGRLLALALAVIATAQSAGSAYAQDPRRGSIVQKGSLLIYPAVEIRWDADGNVVQNTFLTLTNDYAGDVRVAVFYVNGDPPLSARYEGDPPIEVEREHPGWNRVGTEFIVTGDQPVYWDALCGAPAGVVPFSVLDPGVPIGRLDTEASGERLIRGYAMVWAINSATNEISWNHLSGSALTVHYGDSTAFEYNAYAFQTVQDRRGFEPDANPGTINLDGLEYNAAYGKLLVDFYASGPLPLSGGHSTAIDTDLTLLPLIVDLRQDNDGPPKTKADFDVWNMNEIKFSGAERCVSCWDQGLLSLFNSPNHFQRAFLGTAKGKARVDGVGSTVCPYSHDAALLGVLVKQLDLSTGDKAAAAMTMVGQGFESGVIRYDLIEPSESAMSGGVAGVFDLCSLGSAACSTDARCDDGLFCNGAEACSAGLCIAGAPACAADQTCDEAHDLCLGCMTAADCNDGLFCNGIETCVNNACASGPSPCGQACNEATDQCVACMGDGDCSDGAFCNGTEQCDVVTHTCFSGSTPCANQICNETTNQCDPCTSAAQCDDGLFCSGVESCQNGFCVAGATPCTGQLCNETNNACVNCLENSHCGDGVFCNGVETCNQSTGTCQPGNPDPCGNQVCVEAVDLCVPCTNSAQCNDGLFCNGIEGCNVGTGLCVNGAAPCAGQACDESSDSCGLVNLTIVTKRTPTQSSASPTLPLSDTTFNNNTALYAELWAQTAHPNGLGCVFADVQYGDGECAIDAVGLSHGVTFNGSPKGEIVPPDGVDEFGGCAASAAVARLSWARVGYVDLIGGENCTAQVCAEPASTATSAWNGPNIAPNAISYGCQEVEFIDCRYDLDGDSFVGPGDLALFAACWLCCDTERCWSKGDCEPKDFDCDGCVGPGDLAYFATAWLKGCGDNGIVFAPCSGVASLILAPASEEMMNFFNLPLPPEGWPFNSRLTDPGGFTLEKKKDGVRLIHP